MSQETDAESTQRPAWLRPAIAVGFLVLMGIFWALGAQPTHAAQRQRLDLETLRSVRIANAAERLLTADSLRFETFLDVRDDGRSARPDEAERAPYLRGAINEDATATTVESTGRRHVQTSSLLYVTAPDLATNDGVSNLSSVARVIGDRWGRVRLDATGFQPEMLDRTPIAVPMHWPDIVGALDNVAETLEGGIETVRGDDTQVFYLPMDSSLIVNTFPWRNLPPPTDKPISLKVHLGEGDTLRRIEYRITSDIFDLGDVDFDIDAWHAIEFFDVGEEFPIDLPVDPVDITGAVVEATSGSR